MEEEEKRQNLLPKQNWRAFINFYYFFFLIILHVLKCLSIVLHTYISSEWNLYKNEMLNGFIFQISAKFLFMWKWNKALELSYTHAFHIYVWICVIIIFAFFAWNFFPTEIFVIHIYVWSKRCFYVLTSRLGLFLSSWIKLEMIRIIYSN